MGMVFGVQREEEPAYTVVLDRTTSANANTNNVVPYEIRQYGERYAIETAFTDSGGDNKKETEAPFFKLAGYIGVMSAPENEGGTGIAMTAPVAMHRDNDSGSKGKGGEKIAMTAPVAMHRSSDTNGTSSSSSSGAGTKVMQFFLPSKYDSLEKIPKPTNPDVHIKTIPPALGAVHRYTGTFSESRSKAKAKALVDQLKQDGLGGNGDDAKTDKNTLDEEKALATYQFWGYNPPFTIPYFRRNEVWVELSEDQVELLKKKDI